MSRAAGTVLHLCEPGAWLGLEHGRLIARRGEEVLSNHPLAWTSMVACHHRSCTISGGAIAGLMAEGCAVGWFTGGGRMLARMVPAWGNDVERRCRQHRRCADLAASLAFGRAQAADKIVGGKDGNIADTLGLALFLSGDKAQAIQVQERAVRLATKGNKEEVEARLKEFRESGKN